MSNDKHLTVLHPTDFSDVSSAAFLHALKLALMLKGRLILLHIYPDDHEGAHSWDHFPQVRTTLARWGLLPSDARRSSVKETLDLDVFKFDLPAGDVTSAIASFAIKEDASLIVMGTHGRQGFKYWMEGSVAEQVSEAVRLPTLFLPAGVSGFVDAQSGTLSLQKVIMPVDHQPDPTPALHVLGPLLQVLGTETNCLDLIHVGDKAPTLHAGKERHSFPVREIRGRIEEAILESAQDADLIVMPTEGRRGFLDVLRGSTTERIVQRAMCPVLAIPVRQFK